MNELCRLVLHVRLFYVCNDSSLDQTLPMLVDDVLTLRAFQHDQSH